MNSLGVVLSAGTGERFKSSLPKQYHEICGKRVISYVIESLKNSDLTEIVAMCSDSFSALISQENKVKTLIGGDSRNQTILKALNYARDKNFDKILFFDSARPNIKPEYVTECLKKLDEYDVVITTQKITDSLGNSDGQNLNRDDFYLIQTPECFRLKTLEGFDENFEGTAIVQQVNKECKIFKNFNLQNNIKITYPMDLKIAEMILKEQK